MHKKTQYYSMLRNEKKWERENDHSFNKSTDAMNLEYNEIKIHYQKLTFRNKNNG